LCFPIPMSRKRSIIHAFRSLCILPLVGLQSAEGSNLHESSMAPGTSTADPSLAQTTLTSNAMPPPPGFEERLQAQFQASEFVGMGVACLDASGVRYVKGFGFADKEAGLHYNPETLQPIASISKVLIGLALMRAQELGLLHLDDQADKHLPFALSHPWHPDEAIKLRHLASHSSGIRDGNHYDHSYIFETPLDGMHKRLPLWSPTRWFLASKVRKYNRNQDMPMADFLAACFTPEGAFYRKSNFLKNHPGTHYEYSNCGASLAALAIETATGMDYRAFVQKEILTPLGMNDSGWAGAENTAPASQTAKLYLDGVPLPRYHLITYPDGGFVTSISDFSKLMQAAMLGSKGVSNLLTAGSYREMFTQQGPPEGQTGVFWEVRRQTLGHSGMDPGISTFAYFNRERTEGYLIFANSVGFDFSEKPLMDILHTLTRFWNQES
jgi:CubicO group peptidase (beta-lactamase class C family)